MNKDVVEEIRKLFFIMKKNEHPLSLSHDAPIEIKDNNPFENDKLGFEEVINNFKELLPSLRPPFTIGIFGDWGTGKTSFMRMLEATLKNSKEFQTCWFDAWKYEGKDNLILPLLNTIFSKFKIGQKKTHLITSACVIGSSLFDILSKNLIGTEISMGGIEERYKFIQKKLARSYAYFLDEVKQLEKDFRECIEKATGNKTLVVFIDDLDRCLPENVINLLEKIKNYLAVEGTKVIFIIGMDRTILEKSIYARYNTNLIDGNKYLEKIINLQYYLPSVNKENITGFIEHLFQKISNNKFAQKDYHVLILMINKFELYNPRRLRRVVMRCSFYFLFRSEKNTKSTFIHPSTSGQTVLSPNIIFYLILVREFYPEVYKLMKADRNIKFIQNKLYKNYKNKDLSLSEIEDRYNPECVEIITRNDRILLGDEPKNTTKFSIEEQPGVPSIVYFNAVESLYSFNFI